MPAPTLDLATTGSNPSTATKEDLEAKVNAGFLALYGISNPDDRQTAEDAATSATASASTATTQAGIATTQATSASNSAATAQAAAAAAGGTIYATDAAGIAGTVSGDHFYVLRGPGIEIMENVSGTSTHRAWLSDIRFETVSDLLTYTGSFAEGTVLHADGHKYSVALSAATDHHVTTAGGDKLYVSKDLGPYNVLAFGCVGDGVTDDYDAFKAVATAVSNDGGGDVLIPPGTHIYLDRIMHSTGGSGGVPIDGVTDIEWVGSNADGTPKAGVRGLKITGWNAKVSVKGAMTRIDDHGGGISYNFQVSPFTIIGFQSVNLEGFEVDGNVQDRVDSTTLVESGDNNISIRGCEHVTIDSVYSHHAGTDGFAVLRDRRPTDGGNPPSIACKHVTMHNCRGDYNARGNYSLHEAEHVELTNCKGDKGGISDGGTSPTYSPNHNVDIEPDPVATDIGSSGDFGNGHMIFRNCKFTGSGLRNFAANVRQAWVHIEHCYFDNPNNDSFPIVLSVPHVTFIHNEVDINNGRMSVSLSGSIGGNISYFADNKITVNNGEGLFCSGDGSGRVLSLIAERNRFISRATTAVTKSIVNLSHGTDSDTMMIYYRDNYHFFPAAAHNGGSQHIVVSLNVQMAENNVYETDMNSTSSFFGTLYNSGTLTARHGQQVRNERFFAAGAAGTTQAFRSADKSDYDLNFPYSTGLFTAGEYVMFNNGQKIGGAYSVPTGANLTELNRGDIVFRQAAGASQAPAWQCTADGATVKELANNKA